MFDQIFGQIPVGHSVHEHWAQQDHAVLDAAATIVDTHGANPWVFSTDPRHFWQFAGAADVAALNALTAADQFTALCGDWAEEDFDPESFGYPWPR